MLALSDHDLAALLRDDVPNGDLTTQALAIGADSGHIEFRARQPMTVCCSEEAARLFDLAGAVATVVTGSGQTVAPGTPLLHCSGPVAALHAGWKAAQILMEWAGGIATATAAIVAAAGDTPVACTRKNAPGTKALSVKAVRAGGAAMHRLGLSETLLVFAEHRLFLDEAPAATIARLHRSQPEKKVVVEVATPEEAALWARAGAQVLQLEKFTPEQVAATRAALADLAGVVLAVAGGIRADNAAVYVAAGADLLVTSAPYSAPPRDVQVSFGRQP